MPGPNAPYTQLDEQQIIQQCFDETTDRLRVDAELTASIIPAPGLEVNIKAVDDNIAIRNTNNNNELLINPDGSINVTSVISGNPNVNLAQIAGTTTAVNNGNADNGTLRVVIAADNDPITVSAIQGGIFNVGITSGINTIGKVDQGVGGTSAWKVDGSFFDQPVIQATSPWVVSGTVAISNFPATQPVSGTVTANIGTTGGLALDSSLSTINTTLGSPMQNSGGSVTALQGTSPWVVSGTITTSPNVNVHDGSGTSISSTGSSLNVNVTNTVPVSQSGSWTVTANAGTNLNTSALNLEATQSAFKTANHTDLTAINTTLGSPFQAGGSIGNTSFIATQATAANLNATVVGTGTFAVQAAQSGNWSTGRTWTLLNTTDSVNAVQSGTWTVQQGTPPWQVVGNIASGSTDSGNPVKIGGVFNATLPTITDGQRVDRQTDFNGREIVTNAPLDGSKATYSATILGLVPAILATDIFTITGSSTKTIRITQIGFSGTSTGGVDTNIILLRRSTVDSAGTSTNPTKVAMDTNSAAASAVITAYTANPILGTLVGNIRTDKMPLPVTSSASGLANNSAVIWDFGVRPSQAIVLRGTSQQISLNLNGVTIAGASINIWVEWTEE